MVRLTVSNRKGWCYGRAMRGVARYGRFASVQHESDASNGSPAAKRSGAVDTAFELVPAMRSGSICPDDAGKSLSGWHSVGRGELRPRNEGERNCHAGAGILFR